MRASKILPVLLPWFLALSCVDSYVPEIEEEKETLVINGVVADGPGPQQVIVSLSSPYLDPGFNPVEACVVSVMNDRGQIQTFDEVSPGIYEFDPLPGFIAVGSSYSLHVVTPGGEEYRSDYDTLLACPPMDSLYFDQETEETTDPGVVYHGLQFYVDVSAAGSSSGNYRWIVDDTWEYTAPMIPDLIYDGKTVEIFASDSIYRCYRDTRVAELFTATTRTLSVDELRRSPLHYVSNETPRLKYNYEVKVRLHSLSEDCYRYWDQMKVQAKGGEGLYATQPASIQGNIYNVNDPDEKVLGYFYATQERVSSKLIHNEFDFEVSGYPCQLYMVYWLSRLGDDYPYYLYSKSPMGIGPPYETGPRKCFDCRSYGGVTEKPAYW